MSRILIVDDNRDFLDVTSMLLSRAGHSCTTCTSASDALEKIDALDPDIALLDIGMPKLTGYDLVGELRRRQTRALLVAFTAFAGPDDRERLLAAGFDFHLAKPALPEQILAVVALASARNQARTS